MTTSVGAINEAWLAGGRSCPVDVSPIDVSHTAELIHRAADGSRRRLEAGQPHAQRVPQPRLA